MQSPAPLIPVDPNRSKFDKLSQLTPPLPPASGKRRPPAPPTSSFGQLDALPSCGAGTMTVFAGQSRGHSAGAGHAAASMVRRATAPTPPMYFDSGMTPPASSSPAGSREGNRPDPERREESRDMRRATFAAGFGGRRSTDSLQLLEDENRVLREELSRLQNESLGSLHRRPMAAIAGGGFRGPSSNTVTKSCMCDALKVKLARIRAELREARGEHKLLGALPDVRDEEAQTSPKLQAAEKDAPFWQPPQTAPALLNASQQALAASVRRRGAAADAAMQTDGAATTEASSQAGSGTPGCDVEAQTLVEQADFGSQAGCGSSAYVHIETQTAAPPQRLEVASQAIADASEACVQAGQSPFAAADAGSQTHAEVQDTLPRSAAEVAVQAGSFAPDSASPEVATQTERTASKDASCEAAIREPPMQRNSCSAASQTIAHARSVAAVQTAKQPRASTAAQATPPAGIDRSCQVEDTESRRRETDLEARAKELEAEVARLIGENERLKVSSQEMLEKAEAFQHAAQTKAFGQMNVTILCPRAECTVSGERVEMDSWNPQRLREEFEREVLPRFTRVFVEDAPANGSRTSQNGQKSRSEAVDRAMQEFAETFRERLSAMLSAPNAAAAVQAAAAAKGGR